MVTIRLEGSDQMRAALREMSGEVRDEVSKAVIGTALDLRDDVIKSIRQPGTGRTYTHHFFTNSKGRLRQGKKRAAPHTASAPGMPPASDTGRLIQTIVFERINELTASVGSNLAYATYLEYGTLKIAPRPFFRPAVERIRDTFNRRLEAAISGAIR